MPAPISSFSWPTAAPARVAALEEELEAAAASEIPEGRVVPAAKLAEGREMEIQDQRGGDSSRGNGSGRSNVPPHLLAATEAAADEALADALDAMDLLSIKRASPQVVQYDEGGTLLRKEVRLLPVMSDVASLRVIGCPVAFCGGCREGESAKPMPQGKQPRDATNLNAAQDIGNTKAAVRGRLETGRLPELGIVVHEGVEGNCEGIAALDVGRTTILNDGRCVREDRTATWWGTANALDPVQKRGRDWVRAGQMLFDLEGGEHRPAVDGGDDRAICGCNFTSSAHPISMRRGKEEGGLMWRCRLTTNEAGHIGAAGYAGTQQAGGGALIRKFSNEDRRDRKSK
jgi:hypothetical protein